MSTITGFLIIVCGKRVADTVVMANGDLFNADDAIFDVKGDRGGDVRDMDDDDNDIDDECNDDEDDDIDDNVKVFPCFSVLVLVAKILSTLLKFSIFIVFGSLFKLAICRLVLLALSI